MPRGLPPAHCDTADTNTTKSNSRKLLWEGPQHTNSTLGLSEHFGCRLLGAGWGRAVLLLLLLGFAVVETQGPMTNKFGTLRWGCWRGLLDPRFVDSAVHSTVCSTKMCCGL